MTRRDEREVRLIKKLALVNVEPALSQIQRATLKQVLESEMQRPLKGGAKPPEGLFRELTYTKEF